MSLTPAATALTSVGSLDVRANPALKSLEIPALASVGGDLTVILNDALTTVSLPNLSTVAGAVSVSADQMVTNLDLRSLQSVGGSFAIGDLSAEATPLAFPRLVSVGGDLSLSNAVASSQMSVDFAVLSSVAGTMHAVNGVSHLGVPALASAGAVEVQLNRTLPILSFPSLTTEGEPRHLRGPR